MTPKLLLRAIALVCAMLLGMSLQAQVINQPFHVSKVYNPSGMINPNVKLMPKSSFQKMDLVKMREQAQKVVAINDNDLYTITLNLDYDADVFSPPFAAFLHTPDMLWIAFGNGDGALTAQVPPGIYDIEAVFETWSAAYYVIIEQYEVNGSATLSLNPELCTNHISTRCFGPDGDFLKHGLGHFDENGEFVVDEEGSILSTLVDNTFSLNGWSSYSSITYDGPMLDEESRIIPYDIYVSDICGTFSFVQQRIALSNDLSKSYCCWMSTDEVAVDSLTDSPKDYIQHQYTYKFSPMGSEQNGYGFGHAILRANELTGYGFDFYGAKRSDFFTHEVWINIPDTDISNSDIVQVQTKFNDSGELETITYDDGYSEKRFVLTGLSSGQTIRVNKGHKEFANIGHHYDCSYFLFNPIYSVFQNGSLITGYPSSPIAFTYPSEQALGILGDNCPINAVSVEAYENDGQFSLQLQNFFVGRYGETLCSNLGVASNLKHNNSEVDIEEFVPDGSGTYEYTTTNSNVEVDGLPGHNTTTVYFDQNQEDNTPPAVEMLHFRSEEGVTDRFATAADGTMEFYASDFNYQYYPDLWGGVFQCQPVEVTVEYAPYGTEEWNELAVEEIPELYQEPGWGYFYRGSLAGVTGEGLNGWFDLRFRLQDASGNWMDQVVSPAFRIDDQAYSSVATVGSDNAREVARYNLAGQRVDDTHHGVTIVRMSDGTARKVIK